MTREWYIYKTKIRTNASIYREHKNLSELDSSRLLCLSYMNMSHQSAHEARPSPLWSRL